MRLRPPGAAFLDRDGTINVKAPEDEYVTGPDELELLPGAAAAVARLNAAGLAVFVVTNQRGIARGRMTERDLTAVHERLRRELAAAGAHVDAIYHCPHERGTCRCRKPGTGLFERAAAEHPAIDLRRSAMIGDAVSDVEAAAAAGMRAVYIGGTPPAGAAPDHVAADLAAAVDWLLGDAG